MNTNSERTSVDAGEKDWQESGPLRRIGTGLTGVLALFLILEPIWMLLPFAGFLYGSVFQIQTLNQNPHTAWLTHFVFPVLTLGWTGPIFIGVGFALFLIGAGQIYWAKIRRSGLVTGGLYRFVRHPQYVSLTLFGLGVLLTWGRAITFIAFFVMMFVYYYLARSEERTCIRLFGEDYREYSERTSYIIPGDKLLRPLREKLPYMDVPAPVRVAGAFVFTIGVCFGLMWLIQSIKPGLQAIPYMTAEVALGEARNEPIPLEMTENRATGIPFVHAGRTVVVRGPYRNARMSGFAERVLLRIKDSERLSSFLGFLDQPGNDVVVVWCVPYEKPENGGGPGRYAGGGPDGRGPAPDPHGNDRVRLVLMRCTVSPGATIADLLADKSKRTIVRGCVAKVNLSRPEGEEIVEADGRTRGPRFPGEERWAFLQGQFVQLGESAEPSPRTATRPGAFEHARVVLVQAPILRTRIDEGFTKEILHRLVTSKTFKNRLRKARAGGNVIAVAFPRPGPNWYSEHHGKPQVSLFVMLAELSSDGTQQLEDLFHTDRRVLLGAFVAPMDFKIPLNADSVVETTPVGPMRDLEERWSFFLSGVGAESPPHGHIPANTAGG